MAIVKSKRSKACDISQSVKDVVWARDNQRCIICGCSEAMPNAHYIPRSKGGLGIEQNIVTLCMNCHYAFDHTPARKKYAENIKEYLTERYPDWDENELIYKK